MAKIIKKNLMRVFFIKWLIKEIGNIKTKRRIKKDLRIIPNLVYRNVFNKDINWENPTNLIEKIYWLQLYSDTSLWTQCADKYRVRDYVTEKGCSEILNTIYGKWENANDIDWDKLPDSFVLKTNNSCGGIIIVKNKSFLDFNEVTKKLNKWLKIKYGYNNGQFHYTKIKPCVIAEKLLLNKNDQESLVDYKIWCFNGIPESILVVYNRTKENYLLSFFDVEWNNISEKALNKNSKHYSGINLPKPKSFNKMIESAKKLSEGIPQVRIDFYDIDGKAVFGEMTFTTGFGSYSKEYYEYLGSKIDLQMVKRLPSPNIPYNSLNNFK